MAAVVVWWRRDSLPYVAGVLQHVLVGDFLANNIPLLFPLASVTIGLVWDAVGLHQVPRQVQVRGR
jgi:hypothetical protein